jgi:hypothetical protein
LELIQQVIIGHAPVYGGRETGSNSLVWEKTCLPVLKSQKRFKLFRPKDDIEIRGIENK